jgi:hypothetical protein
MRITGIGVVLAAALAAVPAQAHPSTSARGALSEVEGQQLDVRWTPWLGCWQLSGEPVRVCVAPMADARGVTLSTYVDDAAGEPRPAAVLEQTLVADGARHAIAEAECRGSQDAAWSTTGERLFARAELTCSDGAARAVSGLSMIAADGSWIDIQGIEIAGRENIRVRRYERAAERGSGGRVRLKPETVRLKPDTTYDNVTAVAPRLAATAFTIDDVTEAAARLSPRVVEAALVETRAGFDLTSGVLRRLRRARVAAGIIDTMVALSYPRHFIVDRPDSQASGAFAPVDSADLDSPWSAAWSYPYYDTYWSPYWSPYFYAPFGYAYWASYGGYFPYGAYYPATGFVSIDPTGGDGAGGRAINGVGYTRIRERDVVERSGSGGDSTGSSGGSSPGGSSVPTGGGASGVSPGGYSGGSSGGGGDGGRTAQPR